MILITGVPRSGTSFMGRVFRTHGEFMEPPLFTSGFCPGYKFNLMEPSVVSSLCTTGGTLEQFRAVFKDLEKRWQSDNDAELVIKVPQLSFFPEICDEFSKVILCIRELDDAFYKSAVGHGMDSWLWCDPYFLRELNDRTLEGMSKLWRAKAEGISRLFPEKSHIYKFGDKDSFNSLMGNFSPNQETIDDAYNTHWRKNLSAAW